MCNVELPSEFINSVNYNIITNIVTHSIFKSTYIDVLLDIPYYIT